MTLSVKLDTSNPCGEAKLKVLKVKILQFLDSRGSIKAELLHKIETNFCSPKSRFKIKKECLHSCIFNMLENRDLELIIPELFKVRWKRKRLISMKYLNDGIYYSRIFPKFKSKYLYKFKPNDYYFDSRKINFNDQKSVSQWIDHLKCILKKVKDLNKKIIIFNPIESKPIDIYETKFEGEYNLKSNDFQITEIPYPDEKLTIPLEDQAEVLVIIKGYRNRYMCFYITLIESILKNIDDLQKKAVFKDKDLILDNFTKKLAYQCIEFVNSDYIQIEKPNPYRWETFFASLPIKVLNYDFKSIKFYGRTFETYNELKFCIFINKEERETINKLKNLGYFEFSTENTKNEIAMGLNFKFYFPCSTITHIYFLSKYVWAYNLFLLFYHSLDYIQKTIPNIKVTEKERKLYEVFLPVMKSLFNINNAKIIKEAFFKFRTKDPVELEIIYNEFLMREVKSVEKKLFRWFLFRCKK
ncbi:MAG: hypothetical protein EU535_05530 [Promethearchaeota archaeon]|nr:MAG: hypothetical protein EU535_05530 [Candidatus Lokiarchaeota archaeon]